MQTTAEFAGNSNANITLLKQTSLFLSWVRTIFLQGKNIAVKKLSGGVVALEIPRKLTCGNSFCNFFISLQLNDFQKKFLAKKACDCN